MGLGRFFARLPQPISRPLLAALWYLNLMRALELCLMARFVLRVEGWCLLDVGCGHGLYFLDLARRGAILLGCDLQREALTEARHTAQRLGLGIRTCFLLADGAVLPFADGQFDMVVCNCVPEHIADDGAALAASARSLRPGGILYLSVDNADHGLALGFLEHLSLGLQGRLFHPQVLAAPSLLAGLEERLDVLHAVRRRYHSGDLVDRLSGLGLTVLDSQSYLTGAGAAQFEAFHALRGLDPAKGLGRVLHTVSSLLLYPLAAWSDDRKPRPGRGLAIVACQGKAHQ